MNFEFFMQTKLFYGICKDEVQKLLDCMGAYTKKYEKGEVIYHVGEVINNIGMPLCGSVIIENNDLWGNKSILNRIEPGHIFGETYACIEGEPMMVNAVADDKTEVLFFNIEKIFHVCKNSCRYHNMIIKNLLWISAHKNLQLSRRILHTSAKSIRGRLMSYFSECVKQTGSRIIEIPFNRQQLADYLSVDRSAMCSELSKMKKDGLLEYNKNVFHLIENGEI
ncbi:MAG: Crp/Fnr family transcriptional regulator [Monoglobales bacterium]